MIPQEISAFLTEEQYRKFVRLLDDYDMRVGQAFYLSLSSEHRSKVTGTRADPFYLNTFSSVLDTINYLTEGRAHVIDLGSIWTAPLQTVNHSLVYAGPAPIGVLIETVLPRGEDGVGTWTYEILGDPQDGLWAVRADAIECLVAQTASGTDFPTEMPS